MTYVTAKSEWGLILHLRWDLQGPSFSYALYSAALCYFPHAALVALWEFQVLLVISANCFQQSQTSYPHRKTLRKVRVSYSSCCTCPRNQFLSLIIGTHGLPWSNHCDKVTVLSDWLLNRKIHPKAGHAFSLTQTARLRKWKEQISSPNIKIFLVTTNIQRKNPSERGVK